MMKALIIKGNGGEGGHGAGDSSYLGIINNKSSIMKDRYKGGLLKEKEGKYIEMVHIIKDTL